MDKCFRLVTYKAATMQNYKEEKMLTLHQMIKLENSKLGYKLLNKMLPHKIQSLLSTDSKSQRLAKTHAYGTRSKNTMNLPTAKTRVYHTSYLFQALKEFNSTDLQIRNAKSIQQFNQRKKTSLLCK